MLCDIRPALAKRIGKQFGLDDLERDAGYAREKDYVRMDLEEFPGAKLEELKKFLSEDEKGNRGTLNSIKIFERVMSDDDPAPSRLSAFPTAFRKWMQKDKIKGWLFSVHEDGTLEPVLVTSVAYIEADLDNDRPAYVTIRYCYIERGQRRGEG